MVRSVQGWSAWQAQKTDTFTLPTHLLACFSWTVLIASCRNLSVCGSKLDTFTVELCVSEDRKYMNMLAVILKSSSQCTATSLLHSLLTTLLLVTIDVPCR